jgi:dipeptidyl aminopeptidase/acylaminoacyl peptidase
VSADLVAAAGVHVDFLQADGEDLYWQEERPADDGRTALVRRRADGAREDVAADVRTRVHEYGGRAFAVRDGRLVWATDGEEPRLADHEIAPDGRSYVCVREDGDRNDLVRLPLAGGEPEVLASGRDFFAAPRQSPDGTRLAHLAWDHPLMPWDGAELWVDGHRLAGGEGVSCMQPSWAADGSLLWVDDRTGWWNLYRDGTALAPMEAAVGGAAWELGYRDYCELADGTIVAAVTSDGSSRLVAIRDGAVTTVDQSFTELGSLTPYRDGVAAIAAAPDAESSVVTISIPSGDTVVLRAGMDVELEPGWVSRPEHVTFPTAGGAQAHALVYAPLNPDFAAPAGERPPVIVLSHGGPTARASTRLDLDLQYWTTRGFAVADVNYRGSTGYGRAFRDALKGAWGIADVEDCVACVAHLEATGRVDGARAVIRGGSAGGYTTLQALTTTTAFAAGSSHFGVADLGALARETHKFESRYLDGLVAPWPEGEAIYAERSALNHLDGLAAPVILFQGLDDKVVPPDQARTFAAALAAKGIEHELHLYEGEDHGFRRAETRRHVAEAELAFLTRVLAIGSPAS